MGNKQSSQTNSSTTSAPNPQAMAAYQQLMQQASGVASTPYQAYGGELVAPVNAQQNLGISGVNQYANAAQPAISTALSQAQASSQPLTAAQIQQYASPYTQSVVDATQAQFNNQNAQQQQQVIGNAIAQGALGGNRSAIAQAETANQQQLAQAPVIANLYNQGYQTALSTAENQQQTGLAGASLTGNLGVAGQTAGLQGAGQQIGAGTLQQQTQQAQDTAALQQYMQQQAYPYQQLSWLAGIDTGVGSQMGGTSTGQTTTDTSLLSQLLGAGTAGVGILGSTGAFGSAGWLAGLSDVRDKHDIRPVGYLKDGQKVYSFRYNHDPKQVHIGLLAQEVEQKKPHAVHEHAGHKYVDYDAATRARGGVAAYSSGGGVAGFATGGVPTQPWGDAPSWIPQMNITHGSGAPRASAPSPQNQQNSNQQAAQIGQMAKSLTQGLNTDASPQDPGVAVPGDTGPSSVGGPNGPMPLVGVAQPSSGVLNYNSGDAIYARGGGVRGFADGGSPDDSTTFDDRFDAAFPNYVPPPAKTDDNKGVINPDEPYRMPDPAAVDDWRKGVDHDLNRGQTAQNTGSPASVPEDVASSDMPVSQGVAPARNSTAMSFSGDNKSSDTELPDEVTLGYSGHGHGTNGVAVTPQSSNGGVDWGANGKLWPALMSAGFGMMSARGTSPLAAIGEGGQAGLATYGSEQQREAEAQKLAQEMELARRREEREEAQQRTSAGNQPLIIGPDGKAHINKDYISAKQQLERDWQPKMQKIGVNVRGDDVMGVYDPNTKRATDLNGNPVSIINGVVQPLGAAPVTNPAATPQGNPEPQASTGAKPAGATASTSPYGQVASVGGQVPVALQKVQAQSGYQTPAAPPHDFDPKAPAGTEASRDTKYLSQLADQDPGYALAVKKAADYELDPGKYASMMKGHRERFINDVIRYDPNYVPQDVGLRYKAQAAFLPGTKTGDTVRSFNTAVAHLDTLKEAYKAVQNGDWQTFNSLKNRFQAEFGYAPPNTLNAIAQIVGGEVVKATVGAQNALGDREELRKSLEPKLSEGQALQVIDHFQQLMGGQLHSLKFAYEQGTGLHNFNEKYLTPRSQEVLKHIDAEGAGGGSGTSTTPAGPPQGAVGTRKDTSGKSWYVDSNGKVLGPAQ